MSIYLIEIIIILFAGLFLTMQKGQPKRKKLFLTIVAVMLILTLGLRGESVGEDTVNYVRIANSADNLTWGEVFKGFPRSTYGTISYSNGTYYHEKIESGYLILNKLIMEVFHNVVWVQLIVATIICIGFMKFIYDNAENTLLAVWIFICEAIYMNAFNLQRQVMAMAIALQAYTEIKKGRYRHAIGYILVASLFHTAALIYLVLIPVSMFKDYKRGIKLSLIISLVATVSESVLAQIVAYILPQYASYLRNSYWEADVGGVIIVWMLEIILCVLMYRLGVNRHQDYMCIVFTIIYLGMEMIGLNFTAIGRAALFFRAFNILLFSGFTNQLGSKLKRVYFFGIMALTFLEFYSAINVSTRAYSLINW